jgi:hypothetical protein
LQREECISKKVDAHPGMMTRIRGAAQSWRRREIVADKKLQRLRRM